MTSSVELVLASASPRRKNLLSKVGVRFRVEPTDVDEIVLAHELPHEYVVRIAQTKGAALLHKHENSAILSADTIVTKQNQIFGKPRDEAHARGMWRKLSNSEHQVMTAVCLHYAGTQMVRCVTTSVKFSNISRAQMLTYWQSGEPKGKAGAYAIQGLASAWVEELQGSYSNVVGLPLFETNDLLRLIGHNWL